MVNYTHSCRIACPAARYNPHVSQKCSITLRFLFICKRSLQILHTPICIYHGWIVYLRVLNISLMVFSSVSPLSRWGESLFASLSLRCPYVLFDRTLSKTMFCCIFYCDYGIMLSQVLPGNLGTASQYLPIKEYTYFLLVMHILSAFFLYCFCFPRSHSKAWPSPSFFQLPRFTIWFGFVVLLYLLLHLYVKLFTSMSTDFYLLLRLCITWVLETYTYNDISSSSVRVFFADAENWNQILYMQGMYSVIKTPSHFFSPSDDALDWFAVNIIIGFVTVNRDYFGINLCQYTFVFIILHYFTGITSGMIYYF